MQWRSAAVVGGDTLAIHQECLHVLQEQMAQGQTPDVVVLICGINDLKHFCCNPLKNAGPKEFRNRLINLVNDIHALAPNARIVLPSLPTQMFRRDSPLNIFPLTFFVSGVVGFWDSQKKLVASRCGENVDYLGISAKEIYNWYLHPISTTTSSDNESDATGKEEDMSLISVDGIHPNARCYAHWAASLGDKLAKELKVEASRPAIEQDGTPAFAVS